jgi:hypothetical protein
VEARLTKVSHSGRVTVAWLLIIHISCFAELLLEELLSLASRLLHSEFPHIMKSKQAINTEKAPKALPGIYNQAIVANGTVYCSGSIGMSPSTGEMVSGDIQDRTVCSWLESATQQFLLYHEPA